MSWFENTVQEKKKIRMETLMLAHQSVPASTRELAQWLALNIGDVDKNFWRQSSLIKVKWWRQAEHLLSHYAVTKKRHPRAGKGKR